MKVLIYLLVLRFVLVSPREVEGLDTNKFELFRDNLQELVFELKSELSGWLKNLWQLPNEIETNFVLSELLAISLLIVFIIIAWRYYQQYIQQMLEGIP